MSFRTSLGFWNATFFASLGLTPLSGCAGAVSASADGAGGSGTRTHIPELGSGGSGGALTAPDTGVPFGNAGSGGNVGNGGTVQTGSGGAITYQACRGPEDLFVDGKGTGFVQCGAGLMHRTSVVECPTTLPRPGACATGPSDPMYGDCGSDGDCTAMPYGTCSWSNTQHAKCTCSYGCRTDADCGNSQICLCGGVAGACVPATCKQDSDCADGALCLSYHGCSGVAFACQTPNDACLTDGDCSPGIGCTVLTRSRECSATCAGTGGSGGRPFLVFGEARTAPVIARADFASDLSPYTGELSARDRTALGAHYLEIALMEHASIAAFARLSLELLSLGAPSSLVEGAGTAMADEIRHARDAFALAAGYLGRSVGPGPLETADALTGRSPLEIVRTAILEGCIGETVAAVEAAEALAHANVDAVRTALARVVEDETRHAELSWRFVQWVLEEAPTELAERTARALTTIVDAALTESRERGAEAVDTSSALRAHGYLGESERRELRRAVLREVVGPCARALVRSSSARRQVQPRTDRAAASTPQA